MHVLCKVSALLFTADKYYALCLKGCTNHTKLGGYTALVTCLYGAHRLS